MAGTRSFSGGGGTPQSSGPRKRVTFALVGAAMVILLIVASLIGSDESQDGREHDETLAGLSSAEGELDAAMRAAKTARLDRQAYNEAVAALDANRYTEAIRRFRSIVGYRDARLLLDEARAGLKARKRAAHRRRVLAERRRQARQERRRLAAEQRRLERLEREQAEAAPPPVDTGGGCDPNYGGCVPQSSDVDCAGGSGDGPAYAQGPVPVTGTDVYGLDSDSDGTACE